MIENVPAGSYKVVGNSLQKSHFQDADIYSTGASWGKAHETYGEIGNNNISDLYAPNGTENLHRRSIAMTLDGLQARLDAQKSSASNNYFVYNTGVDGNIFDTSSTNGGTTGVTSGAAAGGASASGSVSGSTGVTNPWAATVPGINNGSQTSNGVAAGGADGNGGTLNAPDKEDKQAVFNSRLSLIEKYCEKYGKTVDVDKIKSEYSDNPEEGIKYCDDILNNEFDQGKLKKLVQKEYSDYNKSRLDAGQQVSDKWVDAIIKGGLPAPKTGDGVTTDNVLDVVGTFMTNKEVRRGKVSLENVMEQPEVTSQLIDTLKAKADELLQSEDIDEGTKKTITSQIAVLRDNYDKYTDSIEDDDKHNDLGFNKVRKQLADGYVQLFTTLRVAQAKHNDSVAPQYYGLPEDSSITLSSQSDRVKEELGAYRGRKRLNTTF